MYVRGCGLEIAPGFKCACYKYGIRLDKLQAHPLHSICEALYANVDQVAHYLMALCRLMLLGQQSQSCACCLSTAYSALLL